MTEQQYRVIADREVIGDKVDFETWDAGDRLVYQYPGCGNHPGELVRIERPVPTEHCLSTAQHAGHEWGAHEGQPGSGYWCPGFDASDEHPSVTKPRRFSLQWWVQQAFWTVTGAMVVLALYVPQSLIGPV